VHIKLNGTLIIISQLFARHRNATNSTMNYPNRVRRSASTTTEVRSLVVMNFEIGCHMVAALRQYRSA
jgi:hypothetical protein